MPRPTTKEALLQAGAEQFEKLWKLIDSMSEEEQNAAFLFEDRDKILRDVLIHLYEWHNMMQRWYDGGVTQGGLPEIPGRGYTWRTLPGLNAEIWDMYQDMPLNTAKEKLRGSHVAVMALIAPHSDEELFGRGVYKFTKSTTLGAYFISATASHYDWAMKKIKAHIKAYRAAQ